MTDNQLILTISSLFDTEILGEKLGAIAQPGDVILLYGDLGTGKTTLTQSIAHGLSVSQEQYVTSPSFALMHEYSGRIPLYHIDCYRLGGEEDILEAGLLDYIENDVGLCIIEWPERLGTLIPVQRLTIHLCSSGTTQREMTLEPYGSAWVDRLQNLRKESFFINRLFSSQRHA